MADREDVEAFLREFHQKMKVWSILFRDDRGKNAQTLAELELRPNEREKVLMGLEVENYSQGPIEDTILGGSDLWVFGTIVKNEEIYIKVTFGMPGNPGVICISFHIAEYEMRYPFKTN